MKAYEIDDGVSYWVAASDIKEALALYFALPEVAETIADNIIISIEEVPRKRQRKVRIKRDGEEGSDCVLDLVNEAKASQVLGGSEWP